MVVVAASAEGRPAGSAGVGGGGKEDLQEYHVDLLGEEGLLEQKVVEGDLLEHYVVREENLLEQYYQHLFLQWI